MNIPARPEITQAKEVTKHAKGTTFTAGTGTKGQRGTKTMYKRRKTEGTSAPVNTEGTRPGSALVKGCRGRLKPIIEIPLETLHEIFRNLEPIDLLHLSWASKSLNTIVMGKSARYIWQESFEQFYASENPPPPCPEDVNLAQYTHFLFSRKCMECRAGGKCWVSWTLRLRVCSGCLQTERFTVLGRSNYSYILGYFPVIRTREETFCLTRDYNTPTDKDILLTKRRQLDKREDGTKLFLKWEKNRGYERGEELKQLRQERRTAILNKLTEAGWTETDIRSLTCRKIETIPGFSKAKKLTAKDWDTLQPKLVECLQEVKAGKIEPNLLRKISRNWQKFLKHPYWKGRDGPRNFSPRPVDLAFYEPFKSTIFTSGVEVVGFSQADLIRVENEWVETRNKIVLSMLPADCSSQVVIDEGSQLPSLATIIFRGVKSRLGNDTYYSLDAMCRARDNFFSQIAPEGSASPEELYIMEMINKNPGHWSASEDRERPWMWDHKRFKFCPEAHELAKEMLGFLGLDPDTTTLSQMRGRKERFRCTFCNAGRMTWNAVIAHELDLHDELRKPGIPAKERWQVITAKV